MGGAGLAITLILIVVIPLALLAGVIALANYTANRYGYPVFANHINWLVILAWAAFGMGAFSLSLTLSPQGASPIEASAPAPQQQPTRQHSEPSDSEEVPVSDAALAEEESADDIAAHEAAEAAALAAPDGAVVKPLPADLFDPTQVEN